MIPEAAIIAWRNEAPWSESAQVEQDLIISRAITEIFNDEFLATSLAFRGGTALHKLYLAPAMRYSEDIDLVQTCRGPVGPIFDRLRVALAFLGEAKKTVQKSSGNKMMFKVAATMPPFLPLKLKIEMNSVESASIYGYQKLPYVLSSRWFNGLCTVTTYSIDELLGTKLRALYQRRKGRDLFDLWAALESGTVQPDRVLDAFRYYTSTLGKPYPSRELFMENLVLKMKDDEFSSDIDALIRRGIEYDCYQAYELVCEQLISRI
jgi:predicted nucleotidyltransferase component of viral defense system